MPAPVPTRDLDEHLALIQRVLVLAREQGASAAEADIGSGSGFTGTVRWGEVEKIEHERDKGLAVTVYLDQRKGTAHSTDFSERALSETVKAACDIARYTHADPCAGLADPALLAREFPDLDLYHPWDITPERGIELAIACEDHARATDQRINNSDGTSVSTYSGLHAYGNTHGFAGGWPWSSHTIDCSLLAKDDSGMQRDGWYSKCRDHHDLEDIKAIGAEAARRATVRLGSRKLSSRNVPVIFEAPVASGLFAAFITAISGGSLYRRASFLLDSLGQQVFAGHIRIYEDPFRKKALGSAAFDNEGVATRARDIVKDGVLQGYVLGSYSARKLGLQTTGNAGGVHNLVIETGRQSLAELIKGMNTGLLITDMIGFGVNQVTGDYSRGASGFWIENGEAQYPVEEITVAGNLRDIYRRIVAIGNDVDLRGNILTGSVLIDNMTVAGE